MARFTTFCMIAVAFANYSRLFAEAASYPHTLEEFLSAAGAPDRGVYNVTLGANTPFSLNIGFFANATCPYTTLIGYEPISPELTSHSMEDVFADLQRASEQQRRDQIAAYATNLTLATSNAGNGYFGFDGKSETVLSLNNDVPLHGQYSMSIAGYSDVALIAQVSAFAFFFDDGNSTSPGPRVDAQQTPVPLIAAELLLALAVQEYMIVYAKVKTNPMEAIDALVINIALSCFSALASGIQTSASHYPQPFSTPGLDDVTIAVALLSAGKVSDATGYGLTNAADLLPSLGQDISQKQCSSG